MNTYRRASIALVRIKKKTFVLFALVFILGNLVIGSLSLSEATQISHQNLRRSLPPVIALEEDLDRWFAASEAFAGSPDELWSEVIDWHLTWEHLESVSNLPYVREVEVSFPQHLYSSTLKKAASGYSFLDDFALSSHRQQIRIKGVNRPHFGDLNSDLITIVSGRTFTETEALNESGQNAAMISSAFAEMNNLITGSFFVLENNIFEMMEGIDLSDEALIRQEIFEFEVIGIFEQERQVQTGDDFMNLVLQWELANTIYVPIAIGRAAWDFQMSATKQLRNPENQAGFDRFIREAEAHGVNGRVVMQLRDPGELELFREAANDLLPGFWEVVDLSDIYQDIAHVLAFYENLANMALLTAIWLSFFILGLVIVLSIRDRLKEIGIYLALGLKNQLIIGQLLLEVLVVSAIALSLAFASGYTISSHLSQAFLERQVIAHQEAREIRTRNEATLFSPDSAALAWFTPGHLTVEEMIQQFQFPFPLDLRGVSQFWVVGLGVTSVSLLLPCCLILLIKPKVLLETH